MRQVGSVDAFPGIRDDDLDPVVGGRGSDLQFAALLLHGVEQKIDFFQVVLDRADDDLLAPLLPFP